MGRTGRLDGKSLPFSFRRLSHSFAWRQRRRQMKLARSKQIVPDADDKSPDLQNSTDIELPDTTESEIKTEMARYLHEEQMDGNEEEAEAHNKQDTHMEIIEIIECCKAGSDLVPVKVDNNVEEIEGLKELEDALNAYNEAILHPLIITRVPEANDNVPVTVDNDWVSVEVDNVEEIKGCKELKDACNKETLYPLIVKNDITSVEVVNNEPFEVDNDWVSVKVDNNDSVKIDSKMVEIEEKGAYNEIIERCKDDKHLLFSNIDNVETTENCNKKDDTLNDNSEYEDLKIDNNCSASSVIQEKIPTGNSILNISYFLSELHREFDNHARGIDCQFVYWKLVNYRRRGLLTQFYFKCEMCYYEASIWSHPVEETPDLNVAIVAKSVALGLGYSQLRHMFESMDINTMSFKTYKKYRENLIPVQKNATKNNLSNKNQ